MIDSSRTIDMRQRLTTEYEHRRIAYRQQPSHFNKALRDRIKTIQDPRRQQSNHRNYKQHRQHLPKLQQQKIIEHQSNASTIALDNSNTDPLVGRIGKLLTKYTKMYQPINCSLSTSEKIAERRLSFQKRTLTQKTLEVHQQLPFSKHFPTDCSAFEQSVLDRQKLEQLSKSRLLVSIERQNRIKIQKLFTKKRLSKIRTQIQASLQRFVSN